MTNIYFSLCGVSGTVTDHFLTWLGPNLNPIIGLRQRAVSGNPFDYSAIRACQNITINVN